MADIRPIETLYAGYRFRSRLEARYAVFFDAMNIQWEYERQGYSLPGGPYLPDFWLPSPLNWQDGSGCWVEIKGGEPSARELELAQQLATATKSRVVVFYGIIGNDGSPGFYWNCFLAHPGWDAPYRCSIEECLPTITWDEAKLARAAAAARSARFEHGEKPRGKKATRRKKGQPPKSPPPPIEAPAEIEGPFHVGSLVEHKEYGVGKVTGMSKRDVGFYFEVRFNVCGSRKFMWPKASDSLWVLGKEPPGQPREGTES